MILIAFAKTEYDFFRNQINENLLMRVFVLSLVIKRYPCGISSEPLTVPNRTDQTS